MMKTGKVRNVPPPATELIAAAMKETAKNTASCARVMVFAEFLIAWAGSPWQKCYVCSLFLNVFQPLVAS